MCANKFLAQKVFVVRPGTEIDLGYFLENWPEVKILKPFAGQMVLHLEPFADQTNKPQNPYIHKP